MQEYEGELEKYEYSTFNTFILHQFHKEAALFDLLCIKDYINLSENWTHDFNGFVNLRIGGVLVWPFPANCAMELHNIPALQFQRIKSDYGGIGLFNFHKTDIWLPAKEWREGRI